MTDNASTTSTDRPLKTFFILWTGQALSLVGSQAVQFALIWWLTRETGSATVLAAAAFVGLFPQVALGPLIGTLVDRWNRKRIMFVADAVVALASLGLALLFFSGTARIEHVFAALAVRALGGAFHVPAMLASTSLMVPETQLTRIQGLNQSLQGGLLIITAPLGAFLLVLLPMGGVLMVDVFTALFALVPLALIHVPQPSAASQPAGESGIKSVWRDMVAGCRYLRARSGHLALVCMAAGINMCLVPAFSLLPLLVAGEMGGSAVRLGWLTSTFGVGMIAGGILLGVWGGFSRRIVTSLTAIIALGGAVLILGLAPPTPVLVTFAAMFAVGFVLPAANGPIQAIMQATIAPEYQGRVFTLMGSVAGAMAPLGLVLAAPVADLLGIRAWYVVSGLACLLMGSVAFLVPAILRLEAPEEEPAPGEEATLASA